MICGNDDAFAVFSSAAFLGNRRMVFWNRFVSLEFSGFTAVEAEKGSLSPAGGASQVECAAAKSSRALVFFICFSG